MVEGVGHRNAGASFNRGTNMVNQSIDPDSPRDGLCDNHIACHPAFFVTARCMWRCISSLTSSGGGVPFVVID